MMNPALAGDAPYRVPRDNRRWPALALAVAMHAGLVVALWIGVNWQSSQPVAVEAEVWDLKTEAAAPLAPPAPEPAEAPPPVEAPLAKPVPAEAVEAPPVPKAPDIALERRKAALKEAREKLAELKLKEQQREAQEKADKAKAEAKLKADAKLKAEAKAKAEADAKAKSDAKTKADNADKLAKAKQAAADQKAADNARRLEMSRITGAVGTGGTGSAAKSTGPRTDDGYGAAVKSKIKSNLAYSGNTDMPGNPRAVFKIEQLPTGEVISIKKITSSGVPAFDAAVEKAIEKSSPLPKKKDGTVERVVDAFFEMKDQK